MQQHPNVLYIHSHDTGRYVSPYGAPVESPNIQAFAEAGVMFRNAFSVAPVCSASRAGLLTGQWAHVAGMNGLANFKEDIAGPENPGLEISFSLLDYGRHLVTTLKEAGYVTALSGIQHVDGPFEDTSVYGSRIGYDHVLTREDKRHRWDHRRVTERAVEFLGKAPKDQPFFLSVGFSETHTPFSPARERDDARYIQPPAPLPDEERVREDFADFRATVRRLDEQVGEVLDALRASGQEENTLVILATDHGIPFPRMKCNLFDAGIGVMLMMRGPGPFSGGKTIEPMVSQIDVFPTLCDFLDIPRPDHLQGESLLPLVEGKTDQVRDELFAEVTFHDKYEPLRCIRTERWKYIRCFHENGGQSADPTRTRELFEEAGWFEEDQPRERLYDLWADPTETCNLAGDPAYTQIQTDLMARLDHWMRDTGDPLLNGPLMVDGQPREIPGMAVRRV